MNEVRLRYVAEVNPPCTAFDRLTAESELTFLPMESVWPDNRLDLSQQRPKSSVAVGYTRFQDGDVLVPKITPTFEAARSVLINGLHNGVGAGTTELHVLRPGPEIDPHFLLYLTRTHTFLKLGEAEMFGVAGQKRVPDEFLRDLRIDLPPIDDQRRIADFLHAESAHVGRLESAYLRALKLLSERRISGVSASATGSDHSEQCDSTLAWSVTLPTDWPEVRLGLLARMGSGHTPSRRHPEWWTNCTIPWITTGEVSQIRDDRREIISRTRECISELGLANSAAELHPAGTVVLCRTASAGYSAVMGIDMATSQDFVTWTCGPRLDPFYLLWCLRAMRQDLLGRLAMGSTHKTIYVPDLQMLRIPLPGLDEQRWIVHQIRNRNSQIDQLVDTVKQQLALLTERKQALITAAVTGQIDVTTARGMDVS